MPSFCVNCGAQLAENDNSTLCPNCRNQMIASQSQAPQVPPPTMDAQTNSYRQKRSSLKMKSLTRSLIETLAILFGFVLIGFSALEIGAQVAYMLGYPATTLFWLPSVAICEIIFLLAILHEFGSLHIEL
jgi:predicted anti-sigma-YlaC factor YlaD